MQGEASETLTVFFLLQWTQPGRNYELTKDGSLRDRDVLTDGLWSCAPTTEPEGRQGDTGSALRGAASLTEENKGVLSSYCAQAPSSVFWGHHRMLSPLQGATLLLSPFHAEETEAQGPVCCSPSRWWCWEVRTRLPDS